MRSASLAKDVFKDVVGLFTISRTIHNLTYYTILFDIWGMDIEY